MKTTGFIQPKIEQDHYVLGGIVSLPKVIIRPDGQWVDFVPVFEPQRKAFETFNCTGFNTLNCIEMLFKQSGLEKNFSDRFVGVLAGTNPAIGGNDPHTVAETIRKNGNIDEGMMPFADSLQTVEEFYSWSGVDEGKCVREGKKWIQGYTFGHEWVFDGFVGNKQELIMESLKYSPLGVSVKAWEKGTDGLFRKGKGERDNHWTVIVGCVPNKYWIVNDSYLEDGQPIKHLEWDYDFGFCKRYALLKKKESTEVKCAWFSGVVSMFFNKNNLQTI